MPVVPMTRNRENTERNYVSEQLPKAIHPAFKAKSEWLDYSIAPQTPAMRARLLSLAAFYSFRLVLGQTAESTATSISPVATSSPATCDPTADYGWSFNSRNQSPCDVVSYLGAACTDGIFTVPSLDPGEFYLGVPLAFANGCRCSSVFYSMLSACAACQKRNWLPWSTYSTNCTSVYLTVFPEGIPTGTAVPHWAFDNVTVWDTFNATVARGEIGLAESTGSVAPSTASAGTPSPSSSPTATASSNTGAIAGGVIGGVVGLGLVLVAVWFFIRRRRAVQTGSNAGLIQPMVQSPYPGHSTQPSYSSQMPKYYDPSDPSTYPTISSSQSPASGATRDQFSSPQASPQFPQHGQTQGMYRGAPEV